MAVCELLKLSCCSASDFLFKPLLLRNKLIVPALILSILFSYCSKNVDVEPTSIEAEVQSSATVEHPFQQRWKTQLQKLRKKGTSLRKTEKYIKLPGRTPGKAVAPTTCSFTPLTTVVDNYFAPFEFWDYILYSDYIWINQLSAIVDDSKQYFGRKGEYNNAVAKQERKLKSFFSTPITPRIKGQHSETLDNRKKVAQVFMLFTGASAEDGYYIADQIIAMNAESKVFPESPLLSMDAFATEDGIIVLGDGLIASLVKTGISSDIVITALLAHEWAHLVQYANMKKWYGYTTATMPQTAEFTRQLELEADFLAGYFLTHKRGATYNWKRVEQFNKLFFNLGDCSFESVGHHGSPAQRQKASMLGYTVADQTMPRGHILTVDKLHAHFMQKRAGVLK